MVESAAEGVRTVGPYRLETRLGGGGMGEVFLSRTRAGRPVAVKVAWPNVAEDPEFRARFVSEVEAARRVGGYHTAPVIDANPHADRPWMATEYVPGPSLHEAVDAHGPLSMELVRLLGAGLAEGLAAIHEAGLVHRDLKPANVLLAEDGPRVIDFGISRALDATTAVTRAGTTMGTPAYMSPEQARGQQTTPASDVFALGCVLGFAATGRTLFGTGRTQAVLYRVMHEDVDLDDVPAGLAPLIAACLAKEAGERPTIPDVLAQLASRSGQGARWLLPPDIAAMARQRSEAARIPVVTVDVPDATQPDPDPTRSHDTVLSAAPAPVPAPDPAPVPATVPRGRVLAWVGVGAAVVVLAVSGVLVFRALTDWYAAVLAGPTVSEPETSAWPTPTPSATPESSATPFDSASQLARHVIEVEVSGASPDEPVRLIYTGLLDVGPTDKIETEVFGREDDDWIDATSDWEERLLVDGALIELHLFAEGTSDDLTCRITFDGDVVSEETRSLDDGTRCSVTDQNYQDLLDEDT
ncbi:serine/threonine protein kinase [Promicromonospora sp. AC04]|uniref:serine/threonine-protein kinase n=1 Tax=Promicromonospora sp. AC04 TaxID=2135723 RepID=UPI000D4114C3|nr:serine/threonine-protein kinase [Promicromonospora sp. AC04]PUB25382.1 serine/threonine protein kinase [Promicromonospora sp. AC04]